MKKLLRTNPGIMSMFLAFGFVSAAFADQVVDCETIKPALLAENWQAVSEACTRFDPNIAALPPVLRIIQGHAYLALNQNNQSLVYLLSVSKKSDRLKWNDWATCFAEAYPENATALYLQGDARARLRRWEEAVTSYTEALHHTRTPLARAMVLNARGVAYAKLNRFEQAHDDLGLACETAPRFVDAYCSLGTLLVLKEAAEGAEQMFEKGLALSVEPQGPEAPALALNGLACAQYGLCRWEQAGQSLDAATQVLPLPLFVANLRTIAVANENCQISGKTNSPLFRFSDFLNWEALREASMKQDEPIHIFMGIELPETLTMDLIDRLNAALKQREFYERVREKIEPSQALQALLSLAEETRSIRSGPPSTGSSAEQDRVIKLNRLVLEYLYPNWIAGHEQRDPGMQLTLTQGLINSRDYKAGLSTSQLMGGYQRMEAYKLGSDVLATVPFCGGLASRWKDHLNTSMGTTRTEMLRRGVDFNPAGVVVDLQGQIVDQGNWPVKSCFGLAQTSFITNLDEVEVE